MKTSAVPDATIPGADALPGVTHWGRVLDDHASVGYQSMRSLHADDDRLQDHFQESHAQSRTLRSVSHLPRKAWGKVRTQSWQAAPGSTPRPEASRH